MVDFRSILVERMEYKDSILYLYCKTFYKVLGSDYYNKYDYNVYHRKVLKFFSFFKFKRVPSSIPFTKKCILSILSAATIAKNNHFEFL